MLAGILASAVLSGLYVRGGAGWLLGFVALVPWLRALDANRTLAGTLLSACAMSVAFAAAVFAWFGVAIGSYTQLGAAAGLAVLLLAAPLFQPQFLAFALVRHVAGRTARPVAARAGRRRGLGGDGMARAQAARRHARLRAVSVSTPAPGRRSSAARPGSRSCCCWSTKASAAALARRADGVRAMAKPLALAALVPLLLAGYGLAALSATPAPAGKPLRIGLVQSNIVDYERLRREKGADAVVREVLDTHFAMSYDAVERQHVDAVLWSETVYPTTFGQPKSEAGAELDREILDIVNAAGVPLVFGTYDRDAAGEYNAAAFVAPGTGLLGFYRKTRVVPAHRVRARLARRADAAALAAVGRHLAAGHRRARVSAAPGRRPRDPGDAADLPRRRGHRPRPSTAPGWARRPS